MLPIKKNTRDCCCLQRLWLANAQILVERSLVGFFEEVIDLVEARVFDGA